jgi:hypothetical protein
MTSQCLSTGHLTRRWPSLRIPAIQDVVRGPVAQGIEQQPSKLKVAGSNPAGVASYIKSLPAIQRHSADRENVSG